MDYCVETAHDCTFWLKGEVQIGYTNLAFAHGHLVKFCDAILEVIRYISEGFEQHIKGHCLVMIFKFPCSDWLIWLCADLSIASLNIM